ncbi:acetolactate synthase catalytic subunit [Microbacterium sp. AK031]|uniref:acetolactate synthase catalytic subunit n=1 Tax=Microbacterium sp. AK031 TaxID=2723076 RepID=UPI002168D5E3|nr:acetolactate synthase catalytic subunit [Microbacterium sp. AK031]MCS3844025.1 acetolactate synthase-1/2/3 large subunit [Microbacterium sp. AK031]
MTRTVAQAVAQAMLRHGITQFFGQSLPSLLVLEAERVGVRQIVYRTENAGGAMADAAARIGNRMTVVTAQNGPAATLLVPPFAEAMKASVPILALVQEVPADRQDRNAFQELDHDRLFAGVTKWSRKLPSPERIDDYLDMAIVQATTGRPGPVALMLPKDMLAAEAGEPRREQRLGDFPLDRVCPDPARVREAAQVLADARTPVVIAGGGVHLSGASEAIAQLQERFLLPVATTNMGKGAVDEDHPLSYGVIGNAMGVEAPSHPLRKRLLAADAVLLVGTRTNENGTDAWTLVPPEATVIHLDIDGTEIGRNYEAIRLAGDARLGLEALSEALGELHDLRGTGGLGDSDAPALSARRVESEEAAAGAREYGSRIRDEVVSTDGAIDPRHVMEVLDERLTVDDIVVADASFSTLWVTGYLRARRCGQRFLTPRGLAGLGWGYPMSLGAKAASPSSRVVCLSGDGGFGHVWGELETAVRERLDVVLIVLNNSILGFQKHAELHQFGSHTSAIDFGAVDHAAVARSVGMTALRVSDPAGLGAALDEAFAVQGPVLVEVIANPESKPPITIWDPHDQDVFAK